MSKLLAPSAVTGALIEEKPGWIGEWDVGEGIWGLDLLSN